MARLNLNQEASWERGRTAEGAPAGQIDTEQQLRRSVMSCLLWEREAYEDGEEISERIVRLASELPPWKVSYLACEAREQSHLRHVPLLLLSVLAKTGKGHSEVADVIERVIQRADEPAEFLAIHAKVNDTTPAKVKKVMSAQMKKGLARAFRKFDEYQLSKYDREGAVRLRDVLFLTHPKPEDKKQEKLWKRLVKNNLKVPDTWEVALSSGADKKETFERLLREQKLGYLALLRNLRNMAQAGCDEDLVRDAIIARRGGAHRVLPFRYVAAARAAPQFEPAIDQALCEAIAEMPVLSGKTVVLVDVSGSMDQLLSARSDMKRVDAAAALASIIPGDVRMFSFSNEVVEVPARRGMAGVDALVRSQVHSGTRLIEAVAAINRNVKYDRIIVVTDEQAHAASPSYFKSFSGGHQGYYVGSGRFPDPVGRGYVINVASNQNGIGYGRWWQHVDGWSDNIIRWIGEFERAEVS